MESNYQRILDDLQVATLPVVKVDIWAENETFLAAMERNIGRRYPGATGYVSAGGICLLNIGDVPYAAVHEFAHVVSQHVNARIGNNPRWLWEAVALYESGSLINPKGLAYMVSGNYPTLQQLNGDYNAGDQKIYSVGYTIVEFINLTWRKNATIALIESNGNIFKVLSLTDAEFENQWYQFVKAKYLI